LNLITSRVRQWTFVIIHLREIAHIEKPAARFAFEVVFGFAQPRARTPTAGFARAYGIDQTSRKANCRVGPV
jgi:hypothetical protein